MPAAVRSRETNAAAKSRAYSAMRCSPVSGAPDMSQATGGVVGCVGGVVLVVGSVIGPLLRWFVVPSTGP
jgi:hypothetical protein